MAINTKDFTALVREQAAAIQGTATQLVDLTVGSILRAVIEANAAVLLWLQGLILAVLARTRAATSAASDLDSWMADFGFARLGAVAATGVVTFSRFTPTGAVTVPAGTTVQTADGAWSYTTAAALTLAAGVASGQVSVVAAAAGAGGNAASGQVTVIAGSVPPGIDRVTNAAAFVGGADAETDAAFRARFRVWLASLSKGTRNAIGAAIQSVRPGLTYTITEGVTYSGTPQVGHFYVVVDDNTGAPSQALLDQVHAAVDATRALTTTIAVFPPEVVTVNASLSIVVASGNDPAVVRIQVRDAIAAHINSLGLGNPLPHSRLVAIAYDTSPAVVNVSGVLLNGGNADVPASAKQVLKAGVVAVS